jgi:hypothetical protein
LVCGRQEGVGTITASCTAGAPGTDRADPTAEGEGWHGGNTLAVPAPWVVETARADAASKPLVAPGVAQINRLAGAG